MNTIMRNEIVKAIAMYDIRWIRKNFYLPEFDDELHINTLLMELSEYHKAQEKEKELKLPKSLLDFFDKHYNSNPEAIEDLKKRLISDSVINKQILLLHENLTSECIIGLKKIINSITNCDVCKELKLGESYEELVNLLKASNTIDCVICCLSMANNTVGIISVLMYLIGNLGKENICVIYDSTKENKEISIIMDKWDIAYDSYLGLGLNHY